jgi:hypothetical protein
MTQRAITLKFVVPTVLVIAFGIVISIKYIPVDRVGHLVADSRGLAEANPDARLSRVQLLLSSMR